MSEKVTKVEMLERIYSVLDAEGFDAEAEFVQHEIDLLVKRAERAKEKAAEKRAQGDEYQAMVAGALTDEYQTGNAVWEAVGDEDEDGLSLGKVRSRLAQLVRDGVVEKDQISIEVDGKTRKVMGYRLVG